MSRTGIKKYTVHLWWVAPLLLLVYLIYMGFSTPEGLEDVQKIPNMGNQHIQSTSSEHQPYNSNPPTSGPHAGTVRWGFHSQPISDESQVHNLEDGGVIIQYKASELSDEERKEMQAIVNSTKRKNVIIAPRTEMDHKIVLTAWNRLLPLTEVDELKITAFIKEYEGKDHHVRVGR
jgi:hypothetical protein